MAPVKALIADDERLAREYLRQLLETRTDMVVAGECRNGLETVNSIFSLQPDLVFLDIQMPDLNGFDVIKEVQKEMKMPAVVFTTAYEQFALKAFDVSAVDYLLKPFTEERFKEAVTKALDLAQKNKLSETNAAIESLLKLYNEKKEPGRGESFPGRILVKANKRIFFVNVEEIIWLEASGDYVRIHLKDASYLLNDSLNNIEQSFDPRLFIRVHRSHIVNLECIVEFKPYFNGEYILVMNNRQEVKLSRSYKDRIKTLLGKDSI